MKNNDQNGAQKPKKMTYGDYTLVGLMGLATAGLAGLLGMTAKDEFTPSSEVEARVVSIDMSTCGGSKYRHSCAWVTTDRGTFLDDSLSLRGKFSSLAARHELETGCTYKMKVLDPGLISSDVRILSAKKDNTKSCRKP